MDSSTSSLDRSISSKRGVWLLFFITTIFIVPVWNPVSVDPDQIPRSTKITEMIILIGGGGGGGGGRGGMLTQNSNWVYIVFKCPLYVFVVVILKHK